MTALHHEGSVIIPKTADEIYDLVSDVTRMGEWSPVCKACWWDEGASATVGAWFTGRNELPERTWETRSQVVAAERGKEFAWVVAATGTRWSFQLKPIENGMQLIETWDFPAEATAVFQERFGEDAEAQIAERSQLARSGIEATLAAIKATAESS